MLPSLARPALVAITSLLVSPLLSGVSALVTNRATTCNGYSELCEKSYGGVTFVGAHNSYAVGVDGLFFNQDQDVTTQLNDGIRLLQMQAHNKTGVINLCHSSCDLFDGGTLEDYLKKGLSPLTPLAVPSYSPISSHTVKGWLDSNPNEVLTLLIVNINNLPASAFDAVFKSVGLDQVSYSPEQASLPASGWPTLGSLIDSGKRLLTFLDNGADTSSVPYLIDEFTNIWETEFSVTDISRFDCSVNRTKGDASTQMFMINHSLNKLIFNQPAPAPELANVTNAASGAGSLGAHVDACRSSVSRAPNFLLVDFYEFGGGSVFQVAADANGVPYNNKAVATPLPTTTASGSSPSSASNFARSVVLMSTSDSRLSSVAVLCGLLIGVLAVL
uniref:PLC-like phosphodiesterase n=1 Tax=Moniliophthora roreri TaxID=221103 RepID=A0A0W0FG92_MONRR